MAHVNLVWGSKLPLKRICWVTKLFRFFWVGVGVEGQEREGGKKRNTHLFLFIVLHSQRKSRGRINTIILFQGQRGATLAHCAWRTCIWLWCFSQLPSYWYPFPKETSVCFAAHAVPRKAPKCTTHPNAHWLRDTPMHMYALMHRAASKQIPSQTPGPTVACVATW